MARRGRPPKDKKWRKCERLDLRVDTTEKEAFRLAADQANQELSVWIRVQLHKAADQELGAARLAKAEGEESPILKDRPNNVRNNRQA
jgi:uncharacterized protein (DUF1778 family)